VPMIMRWPGVIAAGSRTDTYSHHFLDLFATFHDLVAGEVPACHGRSLLPVLRGDTPPGGATPKVSPATPSPAPGVEPDGAAVYCEFHGSHMGLYSMRLLRNDRYSFIYHTNDIDELYDHETDPHELINRVADPAYALVLAQMKRQMVGWMARTGDHLHNEWTVLWLTDDPDLAAEAPGRRRSKW
jgi:arylsulfatase A-like enzyme